MVDLTILFLSGSESIISYATVYGYICGWDLRLPSDKFAWKFKNDIRLGMSKTASFSGIALRSTFYSYFILLNNVNTNNNSL